MCLRSQQTLMVSFTSYSPPNPRQGQPLSIPPVAQTKRCLLKQVSSGMWKGRLGEGTLVFVCFGLFSFCFPSKLGGALLLEHIPFPISCQDLGPVSFSATGSARETQLSSVSQNNSFLVLCRVWLALCRRCLPPHS